MDAGTLFDDLISRLRAGDPSAAAEVFEQFSRRLIALARTRLEGAVRRKVDPEDVLQSALRTFFRRHGRGEFELTGWDGLWSLLSVITLRKCGHVLEHYRAECRDVGRESAPPPTADWLALAREPTPAEAVCLGETVQALLRDKSTRDRRIVELLLQEEPNRAIGEGLGCSERTVERVRRRLREELAAMLG